MKLRDWLIVLSLLFFSNSLTFFLTSKYLVPKIKTIDLLSLKLMDARDIYNQLSQNTPPEEVEKKLEQRRRKLEELLKQEEGIILIKQCVVKGEYEDLTEKYRGILR